MLARLRRNRSGNVMIETALVLTFLSLLGIGAFDFGMAFIRQSQMDNAVRAGTQLGLVRHPTMQQVIDGAVTTQDIRTAVLNSADFLAADPGQDLRVDFSCECPDGTVVQCTSSEVQNLPCSDRRTYLNVTLEHSYDMLFPYPGLPQSMRLRAQSAMRLN